MLNFLLSHLTFTNSKTGKPSYTLTIFLIGGLVINIKLLLSGITICGYTSSVFTGVDYSAAMAAIGGIYSLNKHISLNNSSAPTSPSNDKEPI